MKKASFKFVRKKIQKSKTFFKKKTYIALGKRKSKSSKEKLKKKNFFQQKKSPKNGIENGAPIKKQIWGKKKFGRFLWGAENKKPL